MTDAPKSMEPALSLSKEPALSLSNGPPTARKTRVRTVAVADARKKARGISGPGDCQPTVRTRASLLERLGNWQDRDSWEEFFNTYWKLIYSTARKAGLSDSGAQDVVQETLIGVSRHFPKFRYNAQGSFRAWLRQLTEWRVKDYLRKEQRFPALISQTLSADETTTDVIANLPDPASLVPDEIWEIDWRNNLEEAALARIRSRVEPHTYQLFDCYVKKQWPADKVAERFGVSTGTVYVAKSRILVMLKEEVERLEKETI